VAEDLKLELDKLHHQGAALAPLLRTRKAAAAFETGYQSWYSAALPVVKRLGPDRHAEFKRYYEIDHRRKWRCLANQLAIFRSLQDRLAWRLLDIEDELRVELYSAELKAARVLVGKDARAAGVVAGMVLEGYLRRLIRRHQAKLQKSPARIRDMDQALRKAGVFDAQLWAQVSWLGDIAERCTRDGFAEPTPLQVRDLVDGVDWIVKHVF
jgi:hypothetical protein